MEEIDLKYADYINKICKDDLLKKYCMDYWEDLKKHFEGRYFIKENFANIDLIDNMEMYQDIVFDLFALKQKCSAQEVFYYLITHNLNSIDWEPMNKHNDGYGGYYTATSRKIRLIDNTDGYVNDSYKSFLYHELSHVFAVKTYFKQKIIKYDLSLSMLERKMFGLIKFLDKKDVMKDLQTEMKDTKLIYKELKKYGKKDFDAIPDVYKLLIAPKNFIYELREDGNTSISEILNEVFTLSLRDKLKTTPNTLEREFHTNYVTKYCLDDLSGYLVNYDVALLLKLALKNVSEQDMRFNTAKVVNAVNSLNISSNFMQEVKTDFVNLLTQDVSHPILKEQLPIVAQELNKCDNYTFISVVMGMANNKDVYYNEEDGKKQSPEDYKMLIQSLLIESIKNDYLELCKDKTVEKNAEFFNLSNLMLQQIDNHLIYPYYNMKQIKKSKTKEVYDKNEYLLPVETRDVAFYVERFPECKNINTFNKLIKIVEKAQKASKLIDVNNTLPFLKEQKYLKVNYHIKKSEEVQEDEAGNEIKESDAPALIKEIIKNKKSEKQKANINKIRKVLVTKKEMQVENKEQLVKEMSREK